jgi:hypothetical protein
MNSFPIAIQGPLSALALITSIDIILNSGPMRGREKSSLSIMLVGKSAGAILIWNGLRLGYDYFRGFHRVAVVLIDPHGSVVGDGECGSYNCGQPLTWPGNWSTDTDFLRVYNVYQQLYPGAGGGLTGADFPDSRVYSNIKLYDSWLNHTNIPMHRISRRMIRCALDFVNSPRGGTVSKPPINIVIQNGRGPDRSTVDGAEGIEFFIENLDPYVCESYDAKIQASNNGIVLKTWDAIDMEGNQLVRYHPKRINRVDLTVICGNQHPHKAIHLDYKPPTFDISVETREMSAFISAIHIQDDGYWLSNDYRMNVVLDNNLVYTTSNTTMELKNLSYGRHSATVELIDGFGHRSNTESTSFEIIPNPIHLAFFYPGENAPILHGTPLIVVLRVSNASELEIFRDYIDEFLYTRIFNVNFPVESTDAIPIQIPVNLPLGKHKLIAVARDKSGNEVRTERTVIVFR